MELAKQYIVQCIVSAANNLRLSSEKIEVVAILRENFSSGENTSQQIQKMKKITELSKFAIKLGEICNYIENSKIDFLKISDKFKEHSLGLVRELSSVLDVVTPVMMKKFIADMSEAVISVDLSRKEPKTELKDEIIEEKKESTQPPVEKKKDNVDFKKEYIFEELNKEDDFNFENYEETILKPIKTIDAFLGRLSRYDYEPDEVDNFIQIMQKNSELSMKTGFEILANMHSIFARGLYLIHEKKIPPSQDVIESMRACLIVIVAVVRGKEVDITNYLNKAELFGRKISAKTRNN